MLSEAIINPEQKTAADTGVKRGIFNPIFGGKRPLLVLVQFKFRGIKSQVIFDRLKSSKITIPNDII